MSATTISIVGSVLQLATLVMFFRYAEKSEKAKEVKTMRGTEIVKQCSCGLIHFWIPLDAKFKTPEAADDMTGGWYWNCACKSTLFVSFFKVLVA